MTDANVERFNWMMDWCRREGLAPADAGAWAMAEREWELHLASEQDVGLRTTIDAALARFGAVSGEAGI